jgi:hypothetical protein
VSVDSQTFLGVHRQERQQEFSQAAQGEEEPCQEGPWKGEIRDEGQELIACCCTVLRCGEQKRQFFCVFACSAAILIFAISLLMLLAFLELFSSPLLFPFLSLVLAAQRGCYVRQVVVLPLCSDTFALRVFSYLQMEI